MSVQLRIERFRFDLSRTDLSNNDIQIICDSLSGDINELLVDIVSNAVSEALDTAVDMGADEFVDDIQVLPDSDGSYRISTHSGRTDYSKESREMLPHLLKNAETAQDGSKYKVIPLEQKGAKVQQSMFSVLQAKQDAIDAARTALKEQARNRKTGITEALRMNVAAQVSATRASKQLTRSGGSEVEFKTASSKQDPSTSWVIPEKEADMTEYLQRINERIAEASREAVDSLMNSYYSMYLEE